MPTSKNARKSMNPITVASGKELIVPISAYSVPTAVPACCIRISGPKRADKAAALVKNVIFPTPPQLRNNEKSTVTYTTDGELLHNGI